jgi:hypothetical protein
MLHRGLLTIGRTLAAQAAGLIAFTLLLMPVVCGFLGSGIVVFGLLGLFLPKPSQTSETEFLIEVLAGLGLWTALFVLLQIYVWRPYLGPRLVKAADILQQRFNS